MIANQPLSERALIVKVPKLSVVDDERASRVVAWGALGFRDLYRDLCRGLYWVIELLLTLISTLSLALISALISAFLLNLLLTT